MNYKMIYYILGWVLKIESASMLIPLICSLCYNEKKVTVVWLICILICGASGVLFSIRQPQKKTVYAKEGFVTVALSWIVMSLFGSLPFILSGTITNFADAFFETVSGFTTTGATILSDVEAIPKSMLMWRSLTHWIGGMGVLVFLMALVPLSGSGNIHLLKAESPGPSVGKLVPKMRSTAILLYAIYIVMTLIQIIILLPDKGIGLFEAITLSFGTAGTGGFSILNSGAATYSPYVQYVIGIFMILFGIDFSLYYALLMKEFKKIFTSDEFKVYLCIISSAVILIFINCHWLFNTLEEAFRHIFFTVGSIITTTGYTTVDYNLWPEFSKMIIIGLMIVGACAGSTGGGIKISRIMILVKSIIKEVRTSVHPRTVLKLKLNGRPIPHETVRGVNVYMSAYVIIFAAALLIVSFDNYNFTTNFTAVLVTLNNVGPGLDLVGPMGNFSIFSNLSKIIMSICMLVGRLEIFPMLLLLTPYTWRKS